ncbi:unnamed protein product [Candidula unifasciata]|uniref:EGF-like domain-containing protein n=1 Tax=Candidula unifasciata TaxID=100452 RepID=A0A8S3ZZU3_9EUPU|nr:unnamed protein product [Candidula unifasciata]
MVKSDNFRITVRWRNETFSSGVWAFGDPNDSCVPTSRGVCCARIDWENGMFQGLKDTSCNSYTNRYLCIPKNECSDGTHNCAQICLEKNNGFSCNCNTGYILEKDNKTCQDINECEADTPCEQICSNMVGSYVCSCPSGYELKADRQSCNDVNECQANNGGCQQVCMNTLGSHHCSCHAGYTLDAADGCVDVNECDGRNDCQQNCTNTQGSYTCSCVQGYTLAMDLKLCYDIDECDNSTHLCSQICKNTPGSYKCSCHLGYLLDADDTSCSDQDECQGPHLCGQICNNTHGSYQCSCLNGYTLSEDNQTCRDIDECELGKHRCHHICTNSEGSYWCSCNASHFLDTDNLTCVQSDDCSSNNGCSCQLGLTLDNDGQTCVDIDECQVPGICPQICTNTEGSFLCSCQAGYHLQPHNATCVDDDECISQPCPGACVNTQGGYHCQGCLPGYTENLKSCENINKCANSTTYNCSKLCQNTTGMYNCSDVDSTNPTCLNNHVSNNCLCPAGYYPGPDNSSLCQELSRCQVTLPMCGRSCDNTTWASFCSCHTGFKLQRNSSSCNKRPTSIMCPCTCTGIKRYSSDPIFSAIIKELIFNKQKTNSYRQSKISIPDPRPSAQAIGYSGLVIICLLFACVLCLDILSAALSLAGRHRTTSSQATRESGDGKDKS